MPFYRAADGTERHVAPKVEPIILRAKDGELRPGVAVNCEGHCLMLLLTEVDALVETLIEAKAIAKRGIKLKAQN